MTAALSVSIGGGGLGVDRPATRVGVITTATSLAASFRLRHDVYCELDYVSADPSGVEVDEYDPHALHVGAVDVGTGQLVGTMRVISTGTGAPRGARDLVEEAAGRTIGDARVPVPVLPSLASGEVAELVSRAARGLPLREPSRCVVRPAWRRHGIASDLVAFVTALALRDGPALLVGGCAPEHVAMYARYGYRRLRPDGQTDYFPSVRRRGCVLICAPEDVPDSVWARATMTGGSRC